MGVDTHDPLARHALYFYRNMFGNGVEQILALAMRGQNLPDPRDHVPRDHVRPL